MGLFNVMNELFRAQMENLGSDPTPGLPGRFFYRTDTKKFRGDNGTQIVDLGGGGGGLGGSIIWVPDQTDAGPSESIEYQEPAWTFQAGVTQKLFSLVKVPDSYVAGSQIRMRIVAFSASTGADNFLLQSVATLIRRNTDAINTTTNQRTSTNSAQSNGAPPLVLREIELDLTSTSGQINSVAVSARDLIRVQLSRGTDTDTTDVYFFPLATEVLFQ